MNTIHKILIIFALSFAYIVSSFADDVRVAPGQWKTMFSYGETKQIVPSSHYVFVVSNGGIYYYDKSYQEVKEVSKNAGISAGAIEKILFIEKNNQLMIVHSDLTIDFFDVVKNKCVFTDKTISSKDVVGKTLRALIASEDGVVFLGTDFGIIRYNINKLEVSETYYIGENGAPLGVKSLAVVGDSIYALTASNDIRYADVNNKMLTNYQLWKKIALPEGNPVSVVCHAEKLFFLNSKGLYARGVDGLWYKNTPSFGVPSVVQSYKGCLTARKGNNVAVYTPQSFAYLDIPYDYYIYHIEQSMAVYDNEKNMFWIDNNGLALYHKTGEIEKFMPSGPFQNNYFKVTKADDRILLVGNHGWSTSAILSIYENGEWTNITRESLGEDFNAKNTFYSAVDVVPDPKDKTKYYVPTWCGVFVIKDGKAIERYTTGNSKFEAYAGDLDRTLTESAWMDENGYLFVTNTQTADLIHVLSPDGNWTILSHFPLFARPYAKRHIRTKRGVDVITSEHSNNYVASVLFLDTNGTPVNPNDDKAVSIYNFTYKDGSSSETIAPTRFYAVCEDLNGDVWIGTEQGPLIFKAKTIETVSMMMNEVVRPKITREDDNRFADYLLSSDNIYAIAVDGQNRKWIGTGDNGLYLVSEDGTEIIEHHTAENSLLPSNNISSLYFDGKTGYLYVLTDSGLCVYGTDTSEGKEDYSEITVFPNPVRPEYTGDVIIQGLVENSNVRITDAKGNMVENAMSNGGTYIWSARRNDGTRVATGIYNIFVTTQDGTLYEHKKVAVVK